MRLQERCNLCGSSTWCGKPCHASPNKPEPVTNSVTNSVTNKPPDVTNTVTNRASTSRVQDWRSKNPDRYRDYMRQYMAARRAES